MGTASAILTHNCAVPPQPHFFDPDTTLDETLRALHDLVRCGKVRYVGVSNFLSWHLAKSQEVSGHSVSPVLALLLLFCTVLGSVLSAQVDGWLFPSNKCCDLACGFTFPYFLWRTGWWL